MTRYKKVLKAQAAARMAEEVMPGQMFTHKDKGGMYEFLHFAEMKTNEWVTGVKDLRAPAELAKVVVYRDWKNGAIYVRPLDEFDGKFVQYKP